MSCHFPLMSLCLYAPTSVPSIVCSVSYFCALFINVSVSLSSCLTLHLLLSVHTLICLLSMCFFFLFLFLFLFVFPAYSSFHHFLITRHSTFTYRSLFPCLFSDLSLSSVLPFIFFLPKNLYSKNFHLTWKTVPQLLVNLKTSCNFYSNLEAKNNPSTILLTSGRLCGLISFLPKNFHLTLKKTTH